MSETAQRTPSSKSSNASGARRAGRRSGSSAGTGRQRQTVVWVEREIHSTYTVVLLTYSPAVARWTKRFVLALVAWVTAALAGSSMWTFVRGLS